MGPKKKASARRGQGNGPKRQRRKTPEQEQAEAVLSALDARDHAALQELAFARFGFCNLDLRRRAWQFLLGVSAESGRSSSWRRHLIDADRHEQQARVMLADVQRSVYTWDVHSGLSKTARAQKREVLLEVMLAILCKHKGKFSYFQGFHDIVLVFLEVSAPSQAFSMVERLALFFFSDQLCVPFDKGLLPLLRVLFSLLDLLDPAVASALREAECAEMHFAVPWALTWFAHSLPRLQHQVMRLFDCLLASHPAMILYFIAALLLQFRDQILATERELPEMVCMLQRLPLDSLSVDDWASRTLQLAKRVPPEQLFDRLPASCRRDMPSTSPVFHHPFPWMAALPKAAKLETTADEMWKAAPIYRGATAVRGRGALFFDLRLWRRCLFKNSFASSFGLAVWLLGIAGVLVAQLWSRLNLRSVKA